MGPLEHAFRSGVDVVGSCRGASWTGDHQPSRFTMSGTFPDWSDFLVRFFFVVVAPACHISW